VVLVISQISSFSFQQLDFNFWYFTYHFVFRFVQKKLQLFVSNNCISRFMM
jgi:hypothetical protein